MKFHGRLLLAGIVTAGLSGSALAEPRTVIELFTSQGCSSCPAADKLLGELAKDSSVVALSLPVDYWDYLGWKDTLASPLHTAKQRAYARARGDREIYTPQVVVNGAIPVIGSDKSDIDDAIRQTRDKAMTHSGPPRCRRRQIDGQRSRRERRCDARRSLDLRRERDRARCDWPRGKCRPQSHLLQRFAPLAKDRRLEREGAELDRCGGSNPRRWRGLRRRNSAKRQRREARLDAGRRVRRPSLSARCHYPQA